MMLNTFNEPPRNPEDDTRPTLTVPAVQVGDTDRHPVVTGGRARRGSGGQRLIGLILVVAVAGLVVTAGALLTTNNQPVPVVTTAPDNAGEVNSGEVAANQSPEPTAVVASDAAPALITTDTGEPAANPETPTGGDPVDAADELSVLGPEARDRLLLTPISPQPVNNPFVVERDGLHPFTIIPDRPRNTVIKYTIQKGDTIYDIAQRFNLTQETIAWSNDRRQIWTLVPGEELNIPPVDGVYVQAVGQSTIQQIAAQYQVTDPDIVLNSEANNLRGLSADSVPPSGLWIFIPGGRAEEVNWAPQIEISGGGGGTSGSSGTVGFQLGDPGSCGLLEPGVATGWGNPMSFGTYTVTRGYSDWHPGIDLAASPGTPVYAANGGRVIFAGRNNWGYGLAVVISHGPFQTLYGHLSIVNVSCGQVVGTGQQIGGVGSTGNSSGPHLHFEIMYNGIRSNPAATLAF